MSTPTPTGNGRGHSGQFGKLADWVPDESALARLATDVLIRLAGSKQDGDLLEIPDSGPPDSGLPVHARPDQVPPGQVPPGQVHRTKPADPPRRAPTPPPAMPVPPDFRPLLPSPPAGQPAQARGSQPSFYFIDDRPEAQPAGTALASEPAWFDVEAVRREFPLLAQRVNGHRLIWLDNAATTQKPRSVIDRIAHFYSCENSNIHRGAHALATQATEAFEGARSKVARFLGASSSDDIVFTRGATEAINLVAQTWGRTNIGAGDEIVVSQLEHHANIVPWQRLAAETGAKLRVIGVDDDGQVMLDSLTAQLNHRTKLVAVAHVSNVLGTIVPVDQVIAAAHQAGARVLIDGAQAVAHLQVQVRRLDADFYTFSGHKVFAPTGIGALYAKPELLADMPPWQGGGNMISDVTFEHTAYQPAPAKFEAGTGNIADAIALGAAIDFVTELGLASIGAYEHQLLEYATRQICAVPGLRLIGTAPEKASVLTFVLERHDPAEIGTALDRQGIAVRAGHHCAQPILRKYGLEAAVRPSLAMYNTCAEVDQLVTALHKIAAGAI